LLGNAGPHLPYGKTRFCPAGAIGVLPGSAASGLGGRKRQPSPVIAAPAGCSGGVGKARPVRDQRSPTPRRRAADGRGLGRNCGV